MKKTFHILAFIGLFIISFCLFLFLSFPYEVLKEAIAAQLSQETGYTIRIGELSPSLPLGLSAKKVRVEAPQGGAALALDRLKANLGILPLIIGKIAVSSRLESQGGHMDAQSDFSIFDMISGSMIPAQLSFESNNFPIDGLSAFGMAVGASSPSTSPMLAPMLAAIGFTGRLNGSMEFDLDSKNPTQSSGHAEITLKNAKLKLSDPTLGLPDQIFTKALIKAKVDNGIVNLDKASGFISDELDLALDGKITLKPALPTSQLDMKVTLKLDKGLKEKFGFLTDAMTGKTANDGQLTMQIRGSMAEPSVTTF